MDQFWIIFAIVFGYLLGSINWGLLLGILVFKKDIRQFGSKNAGATNAGRVLGKKMFFTVAFLDIMKGVLAFLILLTLRIIFNVEITIEINEHLTLTEMNIPQLAGAAALIGHTAPLYFKFKGGKGVTTSFATFICIMPLLGITLFLSWAIILITTKLMSLASVLISIVAATLPWFIAQDSMFRSGANNFSLVICSVITGIVVIKHWRNIIRLVTLKEKKMSFSSK